MIERWVFQANKPKQGYLDEKPSSQKRKKYTKQNIATFECRNKDNQRKKSINHVKIGRRSMMVAKIELLTKERQLEAESSNYFNNNGGIFTFSEFTKFRWQYILAYIGIMLADGLQGTHFYVLYEGYGFSVATLYSLGFVSGAFTSPFTGAFVDRFGRKKAAMLYCVLEIIINYMEQYPVLAGLVLSRVIGGITTNLLCSCFETWLITEHRKRGFEEQKLEVILRDSGIVSNSAAILSGFMAHFLASTLGPVGPFQGAVATTFVALILVASLWTENYGNCGVGVSSIHGHVLCAYKAIREDSKISRIGLVQGLVEGSLQTFVFLWSPALRTFAAGAAFDTKGLDNNGEPAYGLIFGGFMASAVLGGVVAPMLRKAVSGALEQSKIGKSKKPPPDGEKANSDDMDAVPVNILCSLSYAVSAMLLSVPCMLKSDSPYAFSVCLISFSIYEFVVGVYVPSEGMLRSIYMPTESMCSTINMLRVITNISVAIGVSSTTFVSLTFSFGVLSLMMLCAFVLQLSLVPRDELAAFVNFARGNVFDSFCNQYTALFLGVIAVLLSRVVSW